MKIILLAACTTDYFVGRLAQTSAAIGEALAAIATAAKWSAPSFQRMRQRQNSDPHFFGELLTTRAQTILGWIGHNLSDAEIAPE